jgi:signal transduction histidine kinase
VIEDLEDADVVNPLLRQRGLQSLLGVPLLARGQALGVLHVGSLTRRSFTAAEVELLQLVAERVGLAIERARLHQETVLLDQLKLNFVAIASHELRTPAAAVYGALATVVGRDDLPPEARDELLGVAYEQSDRLRRLLEQLLDLSRLDSKAISVEPRPVVLRSVLTEIAAGAVPGAAGPRIDVPEELAAVADPLVLERVVSNLLVNAVRHGSQPIVVEAERRDRHLRIAVQDGGAGVPPHLRTRLFERFARGESAAGTGLGLAIARAYARAHGGELFYDDRTAGARFEFVLPQD